MSEPSEAQRRLAGLLLNAVTTGVTRRELPQLWQAIHGRKYLVANYRQADYESQDKLNEDLEFGLLATTMGLLGFSDDVHHAMYANFCGALWYDRPTLFLERELADPLGESSLPLEMVVEDIEWKWPQFRLYLPKAFMTIEREGAPRSLLFLDICKIEAEGLGLPPKYGNEIEAFIQRHAPQMVPYRSPATKLRVAMGEPYMAVVGGLDWSEIGSEQGTSYATIMPWNNKKIGELVNLQGPGLNTPLKLDKADDRLLEQMLQLAFNVLLFLSQKPMLYKPEVVRPAKAEGKHRVKPALLKAHYLGQEQFKAAAAMMHAAAKKAAAVGHQLRLKAHWRKGHWKRQPYGPKNTLRRWQWVSIYHTFGPDETTTTTTNRSDSK